MVRFAKWHPLVQFCFLLCVLLLTCLSRHPVPVALSPLGAAVYLLPLEDLKNVVAKLEGQPECSVKERTAAAVKLLQEAADGHGVCLKLKKKKG